MRRDPKTGAPDFFSFARDFLHAYLPKTRGLSPKTIEAYRISLECYLNYLTDTEHIERDRVSFDHFDRQHLKGWMTWMAHQRHYATKTVTLRLSAVKAFLAYASCEDLTLVALSQAAKALRAPQRKCDDRAAPFGSGHQPKLGSSMSWARPALAQQVP